MREILQAFFVRADNPSGLSQLLSAATNIVKSITCRCSLCVHQILNSFMRLKSENDTRTRSRLGADWLVVRHP